MILFSMTISPDVENQNWTQHSRCELSSADHRGRITLFILLENALPTVAQGAVVLLCHKGMLQAPVESRGALPAPVQFLVHQDLSGPFLQSCLPVGQCPVWNGVSQGQELYFPLLNLMRLLLPISPACQGPSEWQHNHPAYQLLLPILYFLQTCQRCSALSFRSLVKILTYGPLR